MKEQEISSRVTLCQDGKYRWAYEVNLYRNTSILIDLLKVVVVCFAGILAIMGIVGLFQGWAWSLDNLTTTALAFAGIIVFMLVISIISYYIWARLSGGRYAIMFEMDETGIVHKQMDRQVKKNEIVAKIGLAAAVLGGSPGVAGTAMLAASVNTWKSDFRSVRRIIPKRRRHLIKVNELLTKNRIFVDDMQDYEFVLDYIRKRSNKMSRGERLRNDMQGLWRIVKFGVLVLLAVFVVYELMELYNDHQREKRLEQLHKKGKTSDPTKNISDKIIRNTVGQADEEIEPGDDAEPALDVPYTADDGSQWVFSVGGDGALQATHSEGGRQFGFILKKVQTGVYDVYKTGGYTARYRIRIQDGGRTLCVAGSGGTETYRR